MKTPHKSLPFLFWVFIYLASMDFAVNVLFRYPRDPRNISPSRASQFFEYGRSAEGKLAWMTRETDEESAPILTWGWIDEPLIRCFSEVSDSSTHPTITIYGMSHSIELAKDMAKADNSHVVRSAGAPGAVASWAYATYLSDRKSQHSDVVIMAVMTKGVPMMCTTTGATNNFDSVWPYTYPRYYARDGILHSESPPFLSKAGYRDYFFDHAKWREYKAWLRKYDKNYDALIFRKTLLDNSSIVRMLRRAYAFSRQRKQDARVYEAGGGFKGQSEEMEILKAIIVDFAAAAKKDHTLPIIYIVNNAFMGKHLYAALEPTLTSHGILYLSTHTICPPEDPTLFIANNHFIPSKNMLLARAMIDLIKNQEKKS